MNGVDTLRDMYRDAAGAAPPGHGLLGAVRAGLVRRRRRRIATVAAGIVLVALAAGVVVARAPGLGRPEPVGPVMVPLISAPQPVFPYTPHWPHGTFTPLFRASGMMLLGVRGEYAQFDPEPGGPNVGYIIVFVSAEPPAFAGPSVTRSVGGHPAQVRTNVLVDWPKHDGTTGSTIQWQPTPGRWVTLVVEGGVLDADQTVALAAGLREEPTPYPLPIRPTLIPAGWHLDSDSEADSSVTLRPDDPADHRLIEITRATVPVTRPRTWANGTETVYPLAAAFGGHWVIFVHGVVTFDLAAFAAGVVVPG